MRVRDEYNFVKNKKAMAKENKKYLNKCLIELLFWLVFLKMSSWSSILLVSI